jgi:hypothetical protein
MQLDGKMAAKGVRKGFLFVFACALVFVFVEGLSSTFFFSAKIVGEWRRTLPERSHTRYDAELGWVAIPNLYIEDMYGSGVYLRTNVRGFRKNEEIDPRNPPDRLRIICSGDSFTFGWGVDNEHNWCQLLESIDTRLQTVNMGQGGYGIDQAYLWYLRDGTALEHRFHIFAFIADDFNRMQRADFIGYGKPLLRVKDGKLVTENVPVPRRSYYVPWLTQNLHLIRELRAVDFPLRVLQRLVSGQKNIGEPSLQEADARATVMKIFEHLNDINRQKNSSLVLVFLPSYDNYEKSQAADRWRRFLKVETSNKNIPLIDLIDEFQQLAESDVRKLFLLEKGFPHFHYSVAGNQYIAKQLYDRLRLLPGMFTKMPEHDS